MLTDWVLIHRLAREIELRLGGARLDDAGLLPDGRIALLFRRRGVAALLAIDLFSSPPLVTLEEGELGIVVEPGFVRMLARTLRGMMLVGATSRRNDRLVRLRFAARSRFGVGEEIDLYLELVPRYGNLILVKGGNVIAARKEFPLSENPRRAVLIGQPYALPPLPERPNALAPLPSERAEEGSEPLYVYRNGGRLLQASVAPLQGFDDAVLSREDSLLEIFAELRDEQSKRLGNDRTAARRRALIKRLDARERKLHDELAKLSEKRRRAERRDELRERGEQIFATLHTLPGEEHDAAKEQAAAFFAEYKRFGKSIPHFDTRERTVRAGLDAIEMLRWEAERTADEDLSTVEAATAELGPTRSMPAPVHAPAKRKRVRLELRTARGSRIAVGRSPVENVELTFRIARPNDVWFHAQGIPGAHVILARDDRTAAPNEDLELAASLAAYYSRARMATSVAVDYTLRKHVRKQRAAPPGLVWYTHANTIVAQPKSLESVA
jgi:predicted ribosome quality control (RQC) complex YloA/Tae2 family protein